MTAIQLKHYLPEFRFINREHTAILLSLVLFLIFPFISRTVDVTAAAIDAGALSAIVMAVLALLIFKALTWWLIRLIWPVLAEYSQEHFERNFKSLLSWQKVLIYLGFYLLLLYSFVATLSALI